VPLTDALELGDAVNVVVVLGVAVPLTLDDADGADDDVPLTDALELGDAVNVVVVVAVGVAVNVVVVVAVGVAVNVVVVLGVAVPLALGVELDVDVALELVVALAVLVLVLLGVVLGVALGLGVGDSHPLEIPPHTPCAGLAVGDGTFDTVYTDPDPRTTSTAPAVMRSDDRVTEVFVSTTTSRCIELAMAGGTATDVSAPSLSKYGTLFGSVTVTLGPLVAGDSSTQLPMRGLQPVSQMTVRPHQAPMTLAGHHGSSVSVSSTHWPTLG
jgi:hypothetical protein